MNPRDVRIVISLSTVPATLADADQIIALADARKEEQPVLCACAAVILASALAQALDTALWTHAENMAGEDGIPARSTDAGRLSEKGLKSKITDFPATISRGALRLNYRHPHVWALGELIECRNKLLHISERPRVLKGNDPSVQFQEKTFSVSGVPVPKYHWASVSRRRVQSFRDAVRAYIEDVLDRKPDALRDSALVLPNS